MTQKNAVNLFDKTGNFSDICNTQLIMITNGADAMSYKIGISALFAINMTISTTAIANDFSFTGTFAADDEVQLFNFAVGAPSIVTLRTYSYAGGIQASGNVVPPGGFDPILALFDSEGNFTAYNDDGASGTVPFDPNTGVAFDTALEIVLDAGDYTVSVMQYNNKAIEPTLADGFDLSGDPFFTRAYNCTNGQFCDASNVAVYNNRTNEWAFDVLNVESATLVGAVPVPAAIWLFGSGLIGLIGIARRKAA